MLFVCYFGVAIVILVERGAGGETGQHKACGNGMWQEAVWHGGSVKVLLCFHGGSK